jgi:adenylyltransferase/sulfurtransferase
VIAKKPLVFGSIFKFEGQVSVFNYQGGPSYRCLYPESPSEGEVPNCSEVGVLGVLPGFIGTMMVNECLKMILDIGEVISGKVQVFNLLDNSRLLLSLERDDKNFKAKVLEESYTFNCEIEENKEKMKAVTPQELQIRIQSGEEIQLIDVREPFEYEICAIEKSELISLNTIPDNIEKVRRDIPAVFICHHGMRSASAIQYLKGEGFENLINLTGGIDAWAKEVDGEMEVY